MYKPLLHCMFLSLLGSISQTQASVSFRICEYDSNTPFQQRPIMVGTRLTLVVSSDTAMYDGWTGGVFLKDENQLLGQLTCGATFPGINAQINIWEEAAFSGCVIATTDATSAGDWVTIDYVATEQGQCTIGLYDDSVSFDDPIATCALIQVKSRDFNLDKIVNLKDFAEFVDTLQTGYYQAAHDLDSNGVVDFYDFEMFIDYWLENT